MDKKAHWENIYSNKQLTEVSWYQPTPETSLELIAKTNIKKDAAIIDIGGGDSFLVDNLLAQGYTNITVLDISEKAIERAINRLGAKANAVKWLVCDITEFKPTEKYDLWHDRAAFHFLNQESEVESYVKVVNQALAENGHVLIGTFSQNGPLKCSGIDITQYNKEDLTKVFNHLNLQHQFYIEHPTPFGTHQNFNFCWFKK